MKKFKINPVVRGMDLLSIGISVPLAIVIGVLIGYYLKQLTGSNFLFIFFIIVGIGAGIKNLMIAIKAQKKVANKSSKSEKDLNDVWDKMDEEDKSCKKDY